ncbi:VOC family protein [Aeromicrobium ginsengisoli]|uniref:Lactoylglutathione lyase n=1 Tax=Aeromicrobium ginsengisoli TaxID=363867 RepID=A0A5M4FCU1_9ACTN|nr:VOC family protein [Aeromicrobium ginsengisoli]KAA1397117.1 lactoylglutathione lyase [Aeromicrobium ginsengisoli]
MTSRLHHVNIRITDLDRSLAFYAALGLTHEGTLVLGPGYTLVYVGDARGGVLELVLNETDDPDYDRYPGAGHLGFEVDDIHASLTALARLGVTPEAAPTHPGGRTDLNEIVFVRDPDGVRVELLQADWPLPQDPSPAGLGLDA